MRRNILTTSIASLMLAAGLLSSSAYAASPTISASEAPAKASAAKSVSINSANAAVLAEYLIGIGPAKAEAIVNWRSQNGRFSNIEQLLEIKGIGTATLNKNKHLITL